MKPHYSFIAKSQVAQIWGEPARAANLDQTSGGTSR
jgi:hypothetical protein